MKKWSLVSISLFVVSLLIHMYILFLTFTSTPKDPVKNNIQIILLNQNNNIKIDDGNVYANASLNGGGDEQNGHSTSPLDSDNIAKNGDSLKQQEEEIAEKEKEVSKQLSMLRDITENLTKNQKNLNDRDKLKNKEFLDKIKRKQAEIEQQITDYNARPKKYFDGPHTNLHEAAFYVDNWKHRVESWGNNNYPEEARGKYYGNVILTIEIDKTGKILFVQLEKSSGNNILDQAAIESAKKSGPFGMFPEGMKNKMDILVITRTWSYGPDGVVTRNINS